MADLDLAVRAVVREGVEHACLVVTPLVNIQVGSERVRELRCPNSTSAIDDFVACWVREHLPAPPICVFRGLGPEGGRWGLDPELSPEETRALCEAMLRRQLVVYRELIVYGATTFVHVEFGARETSAFKHAARVLIDEAEDIARRASADAEAAALARVDRWILRNVVFFFEVSIDAFLERILPDKLPLLAQRAARAKELLTALGRATRDDLDAIDA